MKCQIGILSIIIFMWSSVGSATSSPTVELNGPVNTVDNLLLEQEFREAIRHSPGKPLDLSKINIQFYNEVKFLKNSKRPQNPRSSAYWELATNKINVSLPDWRQMTTIERQLIARHEAEGILNGKDIDYINSAVDGLIEQQIVENQKRPNENTENSLRLLREHRKTNEVQSGGGGTGVGGGGDFRALMFKYYLYENVINTYNYSYPKGMRNFTDEEFSEVLVMIDKMNIEVDTQVGPGQTYWTDLNTVHIDSNWYNERNWDRFTVYASSLKIVFYMMSFVRGKGVTNYPVEPGNYIK